jgi:dihydrofolate reductase
MRKVIVLTFVSLDGVMKRPGGPMEDTDGNFKHGGWTVPFFDDFLGKAMEKQMGKPFDLLLGRRTFELFASYWPNYEGGKNPINEATKYVASNSIRSHSWSKSVFLRGDVASEVRKLKAQSGPDLQVHGSSMLIQTLLENDLIDELWLKIFPVTLGVGKPLFGKGTIPASFTLAESSVSPSGVILASFKRAGELKTGSF